MWNQLKLVILLLSVASITPGWTVTTSVMPDAPHRVGQSIVIGCLYSGKNLNTVVDWSTTALSADISDQRPLQIFPGFGRSASLNLTSVDSGYCGTYTCTIDETGESGSLSITIVPIFVEQLMGKMVFIETPNLEITFTCTVNGGSGNTVEIEWSGPISLPDPVTIETSDGVFTSNLTLTNVTTDFSGTYHCTARYSNNLCTQNITSNTSLVVVGPPTAISMTDSPVKVDSGENVYLFFEFSSLPSHTAVQCTGPDGIIQTNSAIGIAFNRVDNDAAFEIRLNINLTSVNYTHGGLYSCTANNSAGEATASTLLLVRPVVEPIEVLAKNGDNVTLMCLAQFFPEPSYVWEKLRDSNDTDTIPDVFGFVSGSGENMMATHPFLDFEPVEFGDEGYYRCVVNINGTWMASSDDVLLAVSPEGSVRVEALNMKLLYDPNESTTLSCLSSGGPNNTLMWFLDGDLLEDELGATLNLTELDGGEYTCQVSNRAGSENASIILTEAPSSVTVTTGIDLNIASLNDNVTLTCSNDGGPNNTYGWMKNGIALDGEIGDTLTLTAINASSGGDYTCNVSNAAGSDSGNVMLYVEPYIVTPLPRQILTSSASVVNINCEADGFPTPTVIWNRMDMIMPQSNTSLLEVDPVMFGDEGIYQCVASFEIGGMVFNATDKTTLVVSPEGSVAVSPVDTVFSQGDNTTLVCTAMGGPENTFQWDMNGRIVANESMVEVNDIDASSGGIYTCTVSNAAGNDSASTTLYVAPYIVTPLDEQTLTADGLNVMINCDAAGSPSPTVNWMNMTDSEVSNTSLLQFDPVMFGDEGVYRCVASTQINGTDFTTSDDTTLIVSPEGSVAVSPVDTVFSRGDSTTLVCTAMGGPENTFQWDMNGRIVTNESMLEVNDIDASSGGIYTCTVSNAAGNDSASTTLYVAPYIVTPLDEQTLTADGLNVMINCDAAGSPSPTVNWVDMTDSEVSNTSLLQFDPVMFGDEGVYRCVASAEINGTDFTTSDNTTLIVSPEGSVAVSPVDTVFSRGDSTTLVCTAMGGPENTFQWDMNGRIVANESMVEVNDIDASSGGIYTCTVSNAAGNDSASTTLYVAPYIVTPLEDVTLTSNGSSVNLTCEAEGFPVPSVTWDRNVIEEVVVNDSLLMIPTVMFGEEGLYRCLARVTINGTDFQDSALTTLFVSTEGSVMVSPVDMVFRRGQTVSFNCAAMGGPNNVYIWEKYGEIVANESVLTLMDIDASSGGDYTCTVSNLAGNESATTTLYVAPYFVTQPVSVETSNNTEVNITCEAEAFPDPQYEWEKSGGAEMVRVGVVSVDSPNTLGFSPVVFGDEGMYTCVASITIDMVVYDESSNSAVLTVSPEGSVQVDPTTINSNDSGNATFICSAMGGLGNMFSWTKLRDNVVVVNDSELVLMGIMASDGGQYLCLVENIAGSDNTTVTLNVSPVVTEHPQDQNVTSFEGTIVLRCTATGFPAPLITWFHNNTLESNTSNIMEENVNVYTTRSTLTIPMAERNDSGEYHCRAAIEGYNDIDSNPAIVLVQDTPERPENITAVEIQSRYIILSWMEPHDNNAPIQGYFVLYSQPSFAGGEMVTLNVSEEMVNVTNLFPGFKYNFTVIAYNEIGNSSQSEATQFNTLDEVPSNSPQNVTTATLSSTTIQVMWEEVPPSDRNGMITTYEVFYEPQETFGQLLASDIRNTTNLSMLLEELHPFVNYNISVRAYTSVGSGPFSDDVIEVTEQDRPGMPLNVSAQVNSTTEVIVFWQEVPAFSRNGTILLYEVLYSSIAISQSNRRNTTDNSTFTLLLSGLEEFVEYNITVRAYTEAGAGEESVPVVEVMTPGTIPDSPPPPRQLNMSEIESTAAIVRWDPVPVELANGEILNYTVNYRISEPTMSSSSKKKRQVVNGMLVEECINGGAENANRNLTVGGNQNSALLENLTPNVRYEVRIQAVSTFGAGDFSNSTEFETSEDVPSKPLNLMVEYINSTSLQLGWERPQCEYGIITNYTITYSSNEDDGNEEGEPRSGIVLGADESSLQISNLTINTGYMVSVVAATGAGMGAPANETGMTDEDAPRAVMELNITSTQLVADSNNVNVIFSWMGPSTRNGSYNYNLTYTGDQDGDYPMQRRLNQSMENVVIDGRNMQVSMPITGLPYATYNITVTAFNNKTGRSGPASSYSSRTIIIRPSSVTELSAVASSSESILVKWNLPLYPNGPLTGYRLYYSVMTGPPRANVAGYNSTIVDVTVTQYNITGLTPFTSYSIFVEALGQDVTGLLGNEIAERTNATVTDVTISPTPTSSITANTFTFDIPPANFATGPLKLYAVIVIRVTADLDTNTMNYDNVREFMGNNDEPYVAAAWDNAQNVPDTFEIGTGTTTVADGVTYRNVPLQSNSRYAAVVRVEIVSDDPTMRLISYSPFVEAQTALPYDPVGLGVGIVLIIIVLVCVAVLVVVLLYFYRTKYYLPKREGYAVNDLEMDEHTNVQSLSVIQNPSLPAKPFGHLFEPIPVDEFKEHVKTLHRNDDYPFSEEYSNVEPSHSPTSEATHYPYNASKNRYANISAYDHSRVKLNEIPGRPGSDYINANYIHGYKLDNGFIATQGPVPDSVPDFWRMIWEQNTATIVMVTNLEEKGRVKCHLYWPDEKTNIFGSMRVHIQESLILAEYTVRTFSVTKDDSKDERIVTQYHYTIWPDHGVPEYPTSLLHFVRKVMVSNPANSGPIVVHCSAGVGRTGTFITLFNQLKRIDRERNVNVFNFVRSMRRNRCCMVQTESQYIFIHDALLEAIECGVTEVVARDLKEQYKKLGAVDEIVGLTGLEIEFDKLDNTIHRRPTNTFGTLPVNKPKNRYANAEMFPFDNSRCRLSFIPGVEGSDYINANFIDGYHKRRAFIATQGPLPDTSDDFWRMVWEQKCATIVMLTKEREGGKIKCHRYWPTNGASNFRQYQIILHAVNEYPDYILREFKIVDTKDGSSLPVKQFQYTGWPEEGVPDAGTGLIDLVGQVQKWQRNSGTHPIVVHCSGGSGRTGTFIAISILLERLKTEGVVDVFHTGRTLRLQRPGLIQTVDQYEFCYKTVLEYLDSFELYANFK